MVAMAQNITFFLFYSIQSQGSSLTEANKPQTSKKIHFG